MLNILSETYDSGILTETKDVGNMIAHDTKENALNTSLPWQDSSYWQLNEIWRISSNDTCTFSLSEGEKNVSLYPIN